MPAIYLIGNKKDLEERREISEKEGEELAKKEGFLFKEISVKTDTVGTLNEILRNYRLREIRGGQGFCKDDDGQIVNTDDTERKWWNIYPTGIEYLI